MPIPNDFRLNGALGGWMAGEEYSDEQKKQELANLLTQANTAQINQGTDEKTQLLPLLLQQREQENQIRAKEALAAQLGMANVPQEIANQGLAGQLTGKNTQFQLDQLPKTQELQRGELTGKLQNQEMTNQLGALRKISRVLQTDGPLAAAEASKELGINPQVLLSNPDKLPMAIRHLENQVGWSPAYKQAVDTAGISADASIEGHKIAADASKYVADKNAEARTKAAEVAAAAKKEADAKALTLEKDLTTKKSAWEKAGKPQEGPIAEAYQSAHDDFFTNQNMRTPPQATLLSDGTIGYVAGPQRPIPPSGINKSSATQGQSSSGKSILTPEQRQQMINALKQQGK